MYQSDETKYTGCYQLLYHHAILATIVTSGLRLKVKTKTDMSDLNYYILKLLITYFCRCRNWEYCIWD